MRYKQNELEKLKIKIIIGLYWFKFSELLENQNFCLTKHQTEEFKKIAMERYNLDPIFRHKVNIFFKNLNYEKNEIKNLNDNEKLIEYYIILLLDAYNNFYSRNMRDTEKEKIIKYFKSKYRIEISLYEKYTKNSFDDLINNEKYVNECIVVKK